MATFELMFQQAGNNFIEAAQSSETDKKIFAAQIVMFKIFEVFISNDLLILMIQNYLHLLCGHGYFPFG